MISKRTEAVSGAESKPDDQQLLIEAARRQQILSEISRIFLDYTGTDEVEPLRRVVDRVVAGFGDWCAFSLVQPDGLMKQVAAYHPDPRQRSLAERIWALTPPQRWDAGDPKLNVLLRGTPLIIEEITDEMIRQGAPSTEVFELYKEIGLSSTVVAPMRIGSEPLGVLLLASTGPGGRRYSESDIEFLLAITDRASLAIRNARLTKELSRERDEAERRAAELMAVFAADPNGLNLYDPDGRLKFASPKASELLGIPFESLVGVHYAEIFERHSFQRGKADAQALARIHEIFADRTLPATDEFEFETGSGRRILRRTTVPVTGNGGDYLGRFFVFMDVTRERELDRQRTDFLTVAAHELRTPLTPLSMHLQTMEKKLGRAQAIDASVVAKARRQVGRLANLINDLLDLSRLESGRFELKLEDVSLDRLVTEVASDFRAAESRHEILLRLPEKAVTVHGDAARLEQVVVNLLQNAVKYSPGGGQISVELVPTASSVSVSVTDHGIGVPQAEQVRLFERFFRARNAAVSQFAGLGMGLYISNEIVRRHGGKFDVRSAPGEGSTFTFTLPHTPAVEATPTGPRRILVVDDDDAILEALESYLQDAGYSVERAVNGERALELIRHAPPHLMLVDLMMPVLDGSSLIEQIRREQLAPGVPIIVFSADGATAAKADQVHADGALRKPVDLDDLEAMIQRLLKAPAQA